MTDHKNITIAMLVLSAVVLSVLLVAALRTEPSYAGNTSARMDPYIMMPGGRSDSFDNLYVIDVYQKKINVYSADRNRERLELQDSKDLTGLFER